MDIDDILAEIDSDHIPQETRDLHELTRAWVAERAAPELLPWPEPLMGRMTDRIRRQIERVETQTGDMDPKANFTLIILQTELERFKFLVRSFLRTRIAKIDAHPLSLLPSTPLNPNPLNNPPTNTPLSPSETHYLTTHQTLLHAHYKSSFLSLFPPALRRLDDTAGGVSMVERPDLDTAVFVRVLRDVDEMVVVEGTDVALELRRGGVFVVRYSAVRDLVGGGRVELL